MLAQKDKAFSENIDKNKLNHVALKTFFNICHQWGINEHKNQMALLGLTSESTFYKWRSQVNGRLSKDTLERISYIVGIYKALKILLPYSYIEWVGRENPVFNGKSPLEIMLHGNVADLYVIRNYLDVEQDNLYG